MSERAGNRWRRVGVTLTRDRRSFCPKWTTNSDEDGRLTIGGWLWFTWTIQRWPDA